MKKGIWICFLMLFFLTTRSQIIYTDIVPDVTVSASTSQVVASYFIDMDHDGNYEFELRHFNPGGWDIAVELQYSSSGGTQQVLTDVDDHARPIAAGDTIAPTSKKWGHDVYGVLDSSDWYTGTDRYFGFRFSIAGQLHYGWARVSIPLDHKKFIIKDFAYNSKADAPIICGSKFDLKANYTLPNNICIFPNPASDMLELNGIEGAGTYKIQNMEGQEMMLGNFENGKNIFIADLAKGKYILVLIPKKETCETVSFIFLKN